MNIFGAVIGVLIAALFSGLIIWIVGRLRLGMEVSGFGPAYIAAIVIAVLNAVINAILSAIGVNIGTGLGGAIINLIISALILLTASRWIRGLVVDGFLGAIVASLAIAAVGYLVSLLLSSVL